jgi:putative phosphoribosyl transferase
VRILNQEVISQIQLPQAVIDEVTSQEQKELERRERLYRGDQPKPNVHGRTVILTDDGLATGSTMRAAATALGQLRPLRIIVAVPVGAAETCEEFRSEVDEVVCAATPKPFMAVGAWYSEFSQTSDDEVRELLEKAAAYRSDSSSLAS